MSEGVRSGGRRRKRLTIGHHSIDVVAGLAPIALAFFTYFAAWHFDTISGAGIYLLLFGLALMIAGVGILGLRIRIPNHLDYYGGLALILLAMVAFWAGADLAGTRGFSFGAGTAPRLFASVLAAVGGAITVIGLLVPGQPMGTYALRGPLFVTASIVSFALLIRPVGLIIASFLTFMISAAASNETRWMEATIIAAALTFFCVLVFVYLLGLPFQLWPRF